MVNLVFQYCLNFVSMSNMKKYIIEMNIKDIINMNQSNQRRIERTKRMYVVQHYSLRRLQKLKRKKWGKFSTTKRQRLILLTLTWSLLQRRIRKNISTFSFSEYLKFENRFKYFIGEKWQIFVCLKYYNQRNIYPTIFSPLRYLFLNC